MTTPRSQAERVIRVEEHVTILREQVAEALSEIKALRDEHRREMLLLTEKYNALDKAFAAALGTVRGVKMGWAAAFAALGAGIVAAIGKLTGMFQ